MSAAPAPADPAAAAEAAAAALRAKTHPAPAAATPAPLTPAEVDDAAAQLGRAPMFRRVSDDERRRLAARMHKLSYARGDNIVAQNARADALVVLADGYARRLRVGRDGVERHVDTRSCGATLSALHVTAGAPLYATARCVTQTCAAYAMSRADFRAALADRPALATQLIEGLSEDARGTTTTFRTPLLSQRSHEVNYSAVCVAATVESYYRSALNALLNQRLSGISSPLFPNMHIQVPARIAYIAGFKGLRALFDRQVDPESWDTHPARVTARFANMVAPGVLMTPASSVLEACNVGHVNDEPLLRRSSRGFMPRCGREVIFGIGLNQLSDYCEERYRNVAQNAVVANTAGSLTAGVVAGYFSHVPHNLSVFKMLNPEKGYGELFKMFVDKSVPDWLVPKSIPPSMLPVTKSILACLFPRGVGVRTVQICGSFAILNSIIRMIEWDNRKKIKQVVEAATQEQSIEAGTTMATSPPE